MVASPGVSIIVTGDKKLNALFAEFPIATQKGIARKALRKATKPTLDKAKALAPKDTGGYQRTLGIASFKRSRRFKHRVSLKVANLPKNILREYTRRKIYRLATKTSTAAINPHWWEFGTSKMPPKPHMRPALDSGRSTFPAKLRMLLPPIIDETRRKLKAKYQTG